MSVRDAVVAERLAKATDDLAAVRLLLGAEEPLADQAAFFLQQSAEKALKAVLVHHGVRPERTHDLERIAGQVLEREPSLGPLVGPVTGLTEWAVVSRYPDLVGPAPIEADTVRAVLPRVEALLTAVRALPSAKGASA